MKRSVMEEVVNRRARTAEGARVLMVLIEKAGVTWDPEEPEMAERLVAVPGDQDRGVVTWWLRAEDVRCSRRQLTEAEARAAADLYNRRRDFERVAGEMVALRERYLDNSTVLHAEVSTLLHSWIAHLRSPIQ